MYIEVTMTPDPMVVAAGLDRLGEEIEVDEGPMTDSLGALKASFQRAFDAEGPGWDPWSESYAASMGRRAHGPLPGQSLILTRTSETRDALESDSNYIITHDQIAFDGGSMPDYSHFHLTGTIKMPKRYFLVIDDIAKQQVENEWVGWMNGLAVDFVASVEGFSGNLFSGSFIAMRGAAGRFVG